MVVALILYLAFSSIGLILLKLGLNQGTVFKLAGGSLEVHVSLLLLLGAILYVASFILSLVAMSKMNLTVFYPLSAGLIYVIVCLLGAVFLKESVSMTQMIGMGVILVGIIVMNLHQS